MRLMLRTEKPQLPLQLEETVEIQQALITTRDTFGNLQVLCKDSQEWGDQEPETQIYIYKGHISILF